MKNSIRTSLLVAAVFSLASVGAYASDSSTTTAGLTATVSSINNISCTQSAVDLNGGTGITASGLTARQEVNCSASSKDSSAIDVTAYLPRSSPLTGATPAKPAIPNTDLGWSATTGGNYVSFAALSGSFSADNGAIVATSVTIGDSTLVAFYLGLNVPAATPADTYSETMTVEITPHAL